MIHFGSMPVLDFRFGQWVFECEFEENALPKNARFFYDRRNGYWVTSSAKCAQRLMEYATETARRRIWDKLVPSYQSSSTYEPNHKRVKSRYRYNL